MESFVLQCEGITDGSDLEQDSEREGRQNVGVSSDRFGT